MSSSEPVRADAITYIGSGPRHVTIARLESNDVEVVTVVGSHHVRDRGRLPDDFHLALLLKMRAWSSGQSLMTEAAGTGPRQRCRSCTGAVRVRAIAAPGHRRTCGSPEVACGYPQVRVVECRPQARHSTTGCCFAVARSCLGCRVRAVVSACADTLLLGVHGSARDSFPLAGSPARSAGGSGHRTPNLARRIEMRGAPRNLASSGKKFRDCRRRPTCSCRTCKVSASWMQSPTTGPNRPSRRDRLALPRRQRVEGNGGWTSMNVATSANDARPFDVRLIGFDARDLSRWPVRLGNTGRGADVESAPGQGAP